MVIIIFKDDLYKDFHSLILDIFFILDDDYV